MKPKDFASAGIGILGFLMFMISGSALTGYLTAWEQGYFWFALPMAPNTALMGVAGGLGLMLTGYKFNYLVAIIKKIQDAINLR